MKFFLLCIVFINTLYAQDEPKKITFKVTDGIFYNSLSAKYLIAKNLSFESGLISNQYFDIYKLTIPFGINYQVTDKLSIFSGTALIKYVVPAGSPYLISINNQGNFPFIMSAQYDFSDNFYGKAIFEYNLSNKSQNTNPYLRNFSKSNFKLGMGIKF